MQAKVYDLQGVFSYENARKDLPFYGDRAEEIDKASKTASDFWINYDRPKYEDNEMFKNLLNEIQKRSSL